MNKERCPYCGHKLKDDREQQHMIDRVFEEASKIRKAVTSIRKENYEERQDR